MAIIEQVIIQVDSAGAITELSRVQRSVDGVGAAGARTGQSAATMEAQWNKGMKGMMSSVIGTVAAMKAMHAVTSGMSKGFEEALAVRMPQSIDKFESAWSKMWRGFADSTLDVIPNLDKVSGWFDRNAERIGTILLRINAALLTVGTSEIGFMLSGKGAITSPAGSGSSLAGQPAIPEITDKMMEDETKGRRADAARRQGNFVSNQNEMYKLGGTIEKGEAEILEGNLARREEIRQRYADQAAEIEKDKNDRILDLQMGAAQVLASSTFQAMEDLIAGQKVSGAKFVAGMAKQFGQIVFTKGLGDIAMGTATSANPLTLGLGAAQIAAGKYEVAVGLGLMTGGAVVGGLSRRGGGGGGGGGGGFEGGSAGGGRAGGGGAKEDRTVIINV